MQVHARSSRQAVAPVLATLLMIAVAVAMSVIIFMWSQGFLSQTSSATGGQQGAQNQAAQSSIAVELTTFSPATTGTSGTTCGGASDGTPKITIVVRNVGAVTITLGSLTVTGSTSNAGFKGSITVQTVSSTATSSPAAVGSATDGTWKYSTSSATAAKGVSATINLCQNAAGALTTTGIASGDVISIKVTTNVGTFASAQFTVP